MYTHTYITTDNNYTLIKEGPPEDRLPQPGARAADGVAAGAIYIYIYIYIYIERER